MLKLRDYPGGIPNAINEANIEYRPEHSGYAMFVAWIADDTASEQPVKVSIGFPFINLERINGILLETRAELETAANKGYTGGNSEVVVLTQIGPVAEADTIPS